MSQEMKKVPKRRKESAKKKTPQHRFKDEKNIMLTNNTGGNGLFTAVPSKNQVSRPSSRQGSKLKLPPMLKDGALTEFNNTSLSFATSKTREVEEFVENKLIKILEDKVRVLTTKSEQEKAKRMELDIDLLKLKKDYDELKGHKQLVDNQVIRERELKRVFEKEVTKLKETVATQKIYALNLEKKITDLQGNLSGVQKMKDENIHGLATEKSSMFQKIKQLVNEVEERDEIIEDLRYKL